LAAENIIKGIGIASDTAYNGQFALEKIEKR